MYCSMPGLPEFAIRLASCKIMQFAATWMNIEIIILSEVSQRKRKIMDKLYVEYKKKNGTHELIDKIKRVTDLENKHGFQGIREKG